MPPAIASDRARITDSIEDHINAMGPPVSRGHRKMAAVFTDQTAVYDKHLRDIALEAATTAKVNAFPGIYLAVNGLSKIPAEVRMSALGG